MAAPTFVVQNISEIQLNVLGVILNPLNTFNLLLLPGITQNVIKQSLSDFDGQLNILIKNSQIKITQCNIQISTISSGIYSGVGEAAVIVFPGITGATGPQGSTGPRGATGPFGGPQGPTGARGATGTTGPVGPQGSPGIQGITGSTGPQGTIGSTGPQGIQGSTGPQGPTGPIGATGPGIIPYASGNFIGISTGATFTCLMTLPSGVGPVVNEIIELNIKTYFKTDNSATIDNLKLSLAQVPTGCLYVADELSLIAAGATGPIAVIHANIDTSTTELLADIDGSLSIWRSQATNTWGTGACDIYIANRKTF